MTGEVESAAKKKTKPGVDTNEEKIKLNKRSTPLKEKEQGVRSEEAGGDEKVGRRGKGRSKFDSFIKILLALFILLHIHLYARTRCRSE